MPVIPDQTANDIEDIENDALDVIEETQDAVINYIRERPLTALLATFAFGRPATLAVRVDPNYQAGLAWGRIPELRFVSPLQESGFRGGAG